MNAKTVTSTNSYKVQVAWGILAPNEASSSATASGTALTSGITVTKPLYSGDYSDTGDPVAMTAVASLYDITTTSTFIATTTVTFSELTIPATSNCTSSDIQCISYAYDANGNITKIIDNSTSSAARTVNYTYDTLNRLITASSSNVVSGSNYLQTFSYDALGNILTSPLGTYSYAGNTGSSYADPDAVTSIVSVSGYQYYRSITVTSTPSVASGTNANFPFLFSGTYSWLKTAINGGRIQNVATAPNGSSEPADLMFATSSANCSGTSLNFETESYSSSTGAITDWISVPSLSTGTAIYACYDNTSAITDQSHPSSTWNSHYVAVYHFPTSNGLNASDSTQYGDGGTISGATSTTGEIAGAASFATTTDRIENLTMNAAMNGLTSITVSAWLDPTAQGGGPGFPAIVQKAQSGNDSNIYWRMKQNDDGTANSTKSIGWTTSFTGTTSNYSAGNNSVPYNTWTNVQMTLTNLTLTSTIPIIYINGIATTTFTNASGTGSAPADSTHFDIANRPTGARNFIGGIDELRVSNSVLTPSWVLTEYNNQNSPSTFYAIGSETNVTGGGSSTISLSYDNNGNLLTNGTATNTWNYRNQMTQTVFTSGSSTYAYDYQGERVKLRNGSSTTYYPETTYNITSSTVTKTIFVNGAIIATVQGSTGTILYDLTDQLGGVNLVTATSGAGEETLDYYPYGAVRIDKTAASYGGAQRKYIGQQYDPTTQLSYLNARYYNGVQGQFISQDPVFLGEPARQSIQDPQSLNSYSYSGNNPITKSDPSGRCDDPYSFAVCVADAQAFGQFLNDAITAGLMNRTPYAFSQAQLSSADNQVGADVALFLSGETVSKQASDDLSLLGTAADLLEKYLNAGPKALKKDEGNDKTASNQVSSQNGNQKELDSYLTQPDTNVVFQPNNTKGSAMGVVFNQGQGSNPQSNGDASGYQQLLGLYTKLLTFYQQLTSQPVITSQPTTNKK